MEYEKKYKEVQGWIEKIYPTLQHEQQMEAEAFFPELKESEDEKVRKRLIDLIYKVYANTSYITCVEHEDMLAWLEKQGEQKPASKVEPKFKNGQWIVWQDKYYKVNYNGCGYELVDQNGLSTSLEYGTIEENAHLWTIQDAKDGDVLACPLPKGYENGEQIFIFKSINSRDYVENCIEYYCRICDGVFYENENGYGYMGTTSSPLYPATKEQRKTLIKAMTDAGYTFDFENKELKKIDPSNKELEGKV